MPSATRPIRTLSVCLPTWQGSEFLERVLDALAAQECDLDWDVHAVDSGSTDGTWELLGARGGAFPVPLTRRHIDPLEFDHGDTRNLLAALSGGDLIVFLTQDAIPEGASWLATLAANFKDPTVGAVTCRNVPRPDAHPVTRVMSAADPGYVEGRRETRLPPEGEYERLGAHERRLLYNFNDVASAIRREVWELHPFPRTWFGEDILMARALLEAGWTVVYDDSSTVEHSHDYTPEEVYARSFIDGRFNAEWLDRLAVASASDANVLCQRFQDEDTRALRAAGYEDGEVLEYEVLARSLRRSTFHGLEAGGRTTERRSSTGLLERSTLKVLFVVHGFPPDTWAGTEIYTLNLARELVSRGHEVVVFARVPSANPGDADFEVHERDFEGLRVLGMTNSLAQGSLRESYSNPQAEEAFRRVLAEVRPDVVHFQHLIHTSIGLVSVAKEFGLATVIHCHDYWAVCPRVQLIRPDGVRCDESMGAGCYACVKEKGYGWIPTLKHASDRAGDLFPGLLSLLGRDDYADLAARLPEVVGAYAACDMQISPSRFLRSKLLETGRFDEHRFLYSDNGMRTDHVRALEKNAAEEGTVRFGFVGSLVWYKGGETMVRAFGRLAGLPVELSVHGDFQPEKDEHHAELQRLVHESGARVRFHGRFDNARLSEVYAGIDVLIVPSVWYENSPITIHEAFLTRTPVVASGIGGMAEYVRDGVDGLHFEPGDEGSLAACLRRFVDEPELLDHLSHDFPGVKTIADDAAAMEYRYRGLVAQRRARSSATLLDAPGAGATRREGPVDAQGLSSCCFDPAVPRSSSTSRRAPAVPQGKGGSEAGARELEVRVEVLSLGGEDSVELGGRVLFAGKELGAIEPYRAGREDEVRSFSYTVRGDLGGALRIESALSAEGPEAYLRVRRVVVREGGAC